MSNKIQLFKRTVFVLVILMITAACGSNDLTVEQSVALTVAAGNVPSTLSVDEIVAQTVAASAPTDSTVADPNAGEQPTDPAANSAQPTQPAANLVQPTQPAANPTQPAPPTATPNPMSGTPQVRANLNSNVRSGPGTNYRIISSLSTGAAAIVIAKSPDGGWFLIELPGGSRGWIADSVTDPINAADMAKVQVAATIPPSPTPTATATSTATATPTATPTVTATPTPPTAFITTVNNNPATICYLYIALSSDPSWGDDQLGTSVLATGEAITRSFVWGEYDFWAKDCGDNTIATQYGVTVNGDYTWAIP